MTRHQGRDTRPALAWHAPSGRDHAIQVVDGDRVYVFGGTRGCAARFESGLLDDGAVLDVTTGTWTPLALPATVVAPSLWPIRPVAHALADRRIVLLGRTEPCLYDPRTRVFTSLAETTRGSWRPTGVGGGLMIRWGQVEQVSVGGGCDGPRPPGRGCDPVGPMLQQRDGGVLYAF